MNRDRLIALVAVVCVGVAGFAGWQGGQTRTKATVSAARAEAQMRAVDQFNRLANLLGCEGSVIDEIPIQQGVDLVVKCLEQKRIERMAHEAEQTLNLLEAQREVDRLHALVGRFRQAQAVEDAYLRALLREGLVPRMDGVLAR